MDNKQTGRYAADFKTKTVYHKLGNQRVPGKWTVALDIGYSAVKGMSPNCAFCFPAFAVESNAPVIENSRTDILYRGEDGRQWIVGDLANAILRQDDTANSLNTLYERRRYQSPLYKVLIRTGLALAMMPRNTAAAGVCGVSGAIPEQEITVQTGLPSAYLQEDEPMVKDAFEGRHVFSLRYGNTDWKNYDITIKRDNIYLIEQPMGAVFSASKHDDGTTVTEFTDKPMIADNVLIADGGFGTLNVISITNRVVDKTPNTFADLGMKAVLSLMSDKVYERHGVRLSVHAMQPILEKGYFVKLNRAERRDERIPVADVLKEACEEICDMAMDRIDTAYDSLSNYKYLLLTGGTCDAWKSRIQERYEGMSELKVVFADRNDSLGPVFSNVRGYYLYHIALLKSLEEKRADDKGE